MRYLGGRILWRMWFGKSEHPLTFVQRLELGTIMSW